MKCPWCKGKKYVQLYFRGTISCPNCKGTGEGPDGGRKELKEGLRLNMLGNKYASKKISVK